MLIRDLLWRVSTQLGDITPQFAYYTAEELVMWADDAQAAVCAYVPTACSRIDTVKLRPNVTRQSLEAVGAAEIIPGDGNTVTTADATRVMDIMSNRGADGRTQGRAITVVGRAMLDASDPQWHTRTGDQVYHWLPIDGSPTEFYTYPAVPAGWVECKYAARPSKIPQPAGGWPAYAFTGNERAKTSVNDDYAQELELFIVAKALMKDAQEADGAKGQAMMNQFVTSMGAKQTAIGDTDGAALRQKSPAKSAKGQ